MRQAVTGVLIGSLALVLAAGTRAAGQPAQSEDLRKDIESLRKTLEVIQKDIQEIKGLLSRQGGQRSALGVVLDYASNPFKGERTAPLTLVEFSDYQ